MKFVQQNNERKKTQNEKGKNGSFLFFLVKNDSFRWVPLVWFFLLINYFQ
jgi:hypothetical protein